MSKANEELTAGQPFSFRVRKLNDPEWGLFGSKLGTGYLVPLRSTLMVEFIMAAAFVAQARPLLMLQVFSGAALTIMLTQSQLRMHFPLAH